jgi:hypothetical protein
MQPRGLDQHLDERTLPGRPVADGQMAAQGDQTLRWRIVLILGCGGSAISRDSLPMGANYTSPLPRPRTPRGPGSFPQPSAPRHRLQGEDKRKNTVISTIISEATQHATQQRTRCRVSEATGDARRIEARLQGPPAKREPGGRSAQQPGSSGWIEVALSPRRPAAATPIMESE